MMSRLIPILVAVLAISAGEVFGHEIRPGYLELRQMTVESYSVLWKVPAVGELRLSIKPKLPENCTPASGPIKFHTYGSYNERAVIICKGDIVGRSIAVAGLAAASTDVMVRIVRADGSVQMSRLTSSVPSFTVEALPFQGEVAITYLQLGIAHIFGGVDHLLFVLALLILVKGWRRLIGTITAFTVAHSITLAAATLGFVHVPGPPVEATIALSIMFVANEILNARSGKPGLAERWPWIVAFVFGLLHGLGFASALNEVGLPQHAIPIALLFFNIGVEAGQLLFIATVFAVIGFARQLTRRLGVSQPAWAWRIPPYAIGSVAAFWIFQRLSVF